MLPKIWGPYTWKFIHATTLDYPENPSKEDMENYKNFYTQLQYVLPCGKCRNNLRDHLKSFPLTDEALANRSNLFNWSVDLHNIVNYHTGKPMISYDKAKSLVEKYTTVKKNNMTWYIVGIIFLLIILVLVYYYMIRDRR